MMLVELNPLTGLSVQPANANDNLFLAELFYSTKTFFYELGLPAGIAQSMLEQQYRLQQVAYQEQYPNAITYILFYQRQAVGKVMIDINEHRIHLVDFIMVSTMRGRGLGSAVLEAVKLEATQRQLPVHLCVERENTQAKKLYLRHGFKLESCSDTHESMQWTYIVRDYF
ncbi:MAG: GNAT family N-acetyltransferase [Shewanella sp.]|uniref:GNAT family N-acetyltransferase n=1 Tax=Shewanella cutis TaxID=2766780 RepID=A0ABS9QZL2_9GAMM|nr:MULTISPECIES: GNAT family N-acetyltransferase [Shewanella]MCG9965803.1 GNAT family N-acetyltransferase [Shewanella sp. PS-2]MDI5876913.1 GNAT family N-acetyltransferase [Shewanella xiamenensis]NSM25558.1 GNAT family N-acetyltransferase [Shewanella sp. ZOR0012]